MKKLIPALLILASSAALSTVVGSMKVEQLNEDNTVQSTYQAQVLEDESFDIPPVFVRSYGQEIHVPPNVDMYVRGSHFACFRNIGTGTLVAHYVMIVRGMGKEAKTEGDLTLTKHSALCAGSQPMPNFIWHSGNAGRYGYEVITQGRMGRETKTSTAHGTVYVGQ
jgi:hypothetical protein